MFFGTDKDENKGGFKYVYVLQVRSQVRVVFFGTDKDENKGGFKHVYVLQVRSQVAYSNGAEMYLFLNYQALSLINAWLAANHTPIDY